MKRRLTRKITNVAALAMSVAATSVGLLFLITFVVISAARLMLRRLDRKALGSV